MSTEQKSADYAGITKWIVIGVIVIVALFVLKKPLEGFIYKTSEVEVTGSGVKIKTTQTAIGELKVSSEKITEQQANKIANETQGYKNIVATDFTLSWPTDTWTRSNEEIPKFQQMVTQYKPDAQVILYCREKELNELGGANNLFVLSMPFDNRYSFSDQVKADIELNQQMSNARYTTVEVDEATKGATLIYTYELNGMELYQITRYAYKDGKVYGVFATTFADDAAGQTEVNKIVNSFKIVEG
ncbi:MAG TPA: hypothetical protein PL009_12625 [Flavipsychrobacter sp.]|nr:hypothetical protein [Flavipsychrobacter sp.]